MRCIVRAGTYADGRWVPGAPVTPREQGKVRRESYVRLVCRMCSARGSGELEKRLNGGGAASHRGAIRCKAPRQRRHSWQSRQRGFCKLQNPQEVIGFESHPLRQSHLPRHGVSRSSSRTQVARRTLQTPLRFAAMTLPTLLTAGASREDQLEGFARVRRRCPRTRARSAWPRLEVEEAIVPRDVDEGRIGGPVFEGEGHGRGVRAPPALIRRSRVIRIDRCLRIPRAAEAGDDDSSSVRFNCSDTGRWPSH